MIPRSPSPRDAGLTLIELLIAMAIFAVIGVAGVAVLDTVLDVNARTEGRLERLAEVDRALLVVRRDLAQARPSGMTLDGDRLRFVKSDGEAAQEVTVTLSDSRLTRSLSRGGDVPLEQVLLSGVEALDWRVLDAGRRWQDAVPGGAEGAPLAAELSLVVVLDTGSARIVRLMALPSAVRQ